jgi:hypothetical protein
LSERPDITQGASEAHLEEPLTAPIEEADTVEEPPLDELPPRPRSRFLRPLPLALVGLLIAALGLLAGIELQKGQGSSNSASPFGDLPSSLPGASASGASGGSGGLPSLPGAGGSGASAPITGTVSSLDGRILYITDSQGNTLRVRSRAGSTVTRNAKVGVRAVHPGDSVVIQGSKHAGTVSASSISATAQDASSQSGIGAPSGSGSTGGAARGTQGGSVNSLFGN